MFAGLPQATTMLGGKGYHAKGFRRTLSERGIVLCIPSKTNRKIPLAHDRILYR